MPDTGYAGSSRYVLQKVLAHGGHGEIWQAVQVSLNRVIAVKRIREKHVQTLGDTSYQEIEALFRQEALVASRLDHPNIVPIYDLANDASGRPQLAMKLVEGTEWTVLLARDRKSPEWLSLLPRHLSILVSVCHAVGFAHSRGVIHRDLKPGQVMVGKYGEVFLMDWGLAVVLADAAPNAFTRTLPSPESDGSPRSAGTIAFMAPEQTRSSLARLGVWTDVWLLGGILYCILTGTPPYDDPDARVSVKKAMEGIVEPPEERCPQSDLPPELCRLCMWALSPDIGDRPPSALDFARGIEEYMTGVWQREEALRLVAEADRVLQSQPARYEELAACEKQLSRAMNLQPGNAQTDRLYQALCERFAAVALDNGDLGLARVQAARIVDSAIRSVLEMRTEAKQHQIRTHARQRRMAIAACFVLLLASGALGIFLTSWNAQARVHREQERLEAVSKSGEISRKRTQALEAARQTERTVETADLYAAEARLVRMIPLLWRDYLGFPPVLARTPYDDNVWGSMDRNKAARLRSEFEAWETTRSLLESRGERLAPPPFDLHCAAGTMMLFQNDNRSALRYLARAAEGGPERYLARVRMAVALFREGDLAGAHQTLGDAAAAAFINGGFRGDYQRILVLQRESLAALWRGRTLPQGSTLVESRSGGQNSGSYQEIAGGPWCDSNKPAEWAKSAAPGTAPIIGTRIVRFYDGNDALDTTFPAVARFLPRLRAGGRQYVYVTWPFSASAAPVVFTVRHADGESSVPLIQDGWGFAGPSNANVWVQLGSYSFLPGDDQYVEISAPNGIQPVSRVWNGQVQADAVLFTPKPLDFATTAAQPASAAAMLASETAVAKDVSGWYYDYDKAKEAAQDAGKGLFVLFVTDGKKVSHYLGENLFNDLQVRKAISDSLIPVAFMPRGNSPSAWAFRGYPLGTALILDPQFQVQAALAPAVVTSKSRLLQALRK